MSELYRTPEKIDIGTNPAFSEDLKDLVAKGGYDLVLDMGDTVYISSVGLRTILAMDKECKKNNGKLLIRNAGDMVKKVMEITGFAQILTIE